MVDCSSKVRLSDFLYLSFVFLDIPALFSRFFDGTNPVCRHGRKVAPSPPPPYPKRGAREFPSPDKEWPGVVDL